MKELEAMPPCGKSSVVTGMSFTGPERIIGTGDMWPLTWADDDNIYAAAGDNSGFLDHFQPMNFWKVEGTPPNHEISLVNDLSFITADGRDPESDILPIKPAGVVSVDGILYLAVEDMRYTQGRYGNQVNLQAWVLTSTDHGRTWSEPPKAGSAERLFLTGVFASPHFLQFGRDYGGAPDEWVYAYSSAGDDGVAAWSAGDCTYLARVPRRRILDRSAWEFCAGTANGVPLWSEALEKAAPVFTYPRKTGENEVVYHPGLRRYLLLNWAFIDCVNHMLGSLHSELSVFESEHPWDPGPPCACAATGDRTATTSLGCRQSGSIPAPAPRGWSPPGTFSKGADGSTMPSWPRPWLSTREIMAISIRAAGAFPSWGISPRKR